MLFTEQLADLYSAEGQLIQALPTVADAASSLELRAALEEHHRKTIGHLERIEISKTRSLRKAMPTRS